MDYVKLARANRNSPLWQSVEAYMMGVLDERDGHHTAEDWAAMGFQEMVDDGVAIILKERVERAKQKAEQAGIDATVENILQQSMKLS